MNQMSKGSRSRLAKTIGSALAAVLVGTVVSGSVSQAQAPQKAKTGGEITVAIDGSLAGFCYQTALAGGTLGVSRTIYESLVERSKDGKFVPYLAESFTPSPDYKVWDFVLRPGINGKNG